ncbi:hypothetical protein L1987_61905 [Smallanthus sonchifolius]|uniref:Uncharacterized protein n=1 Tax=Smallanthus sonchifolius TaxID=185202 RepID=A0ACB9C940_9ASTR|nr:hypothetical protein L1987_61905 [Smallanthus sonchifolius]
MVRRMTKEMKVRAVIRVLRVSRFLRRGDYDAEKVKGRKRREMGMKWREWKLRIRFVRRRGDVIEAVKLSFINGVYKLNCEDGKEGMLTNSVIQS